MRTLALDLGEKRIGVALSDPTGFLASALTVIESRTTEAAFNEVIGLAIKHGAERIVVGLPRSLDGTLGRQAQKALDFTEELSKRTSIPVATWDERFSTVSAERVLLESGARRDKRDKHRDAVAAAIILQDYLDAESARAGAVDEEDKYDQGDA